MGPRMPCGSRAGAARMKRLGLRSRTGTWVKYMAMGKLGARRGIVILGEELWLSTNLILGEESWLRHSQT